MDRLDLMISDARAQIRKFQDGIGELRTKIDVMTIRLGILEEAARARPAVDSASDLGSDGSIPSVADPAPIQKRRGGRQLGSISGDWRKTLLDIDDEVGLYGVGLPIESIFELAQRNGVKGNVHSVHDRVRKYCDKVKLLERDGNGFRVKPEIADRYRIELKRPKQHPGPSLFGEAASPSPPAPTQKEPSDATM